MTSWSDVERAVPELAKAVQLRFEATGLGLMATIRTDGSPRICPIEPMFGEELWLGMMEGSRKVADLRRDPRLALHSATIDKNVTEGDAKLTGTAVSVDGDEAHAAFVAEFEARTGTKLPPDPFPLFRLDVAEVSFLRPGGDHLVIEWWRPGDGYHRTERR